MADKKPKNKSLADIANTPAPPAGVTIQQRPLGVSQSYAEQFGKANPGQSLYFAGDENTLAAKLSSEDRASLQMALKQLGYIPASKATTLGKWDPASASGFQKVLIWANANGTDWRSALSDLEQQASTGTTVGGPQGTQATNPLDLRAFAQSQGKKRFGRDLTPEEEAQVAQAEAAAEQPYVGAGSMTGSPGAAGLGLIADQELKRIDATRYDSRRALSAGQVILQALAGGGNG